MNIYNRGKTLNKPFPCFLTSAGFLLPSNENYSCQGCLMTLYTVSFSLHQQAQITSIQLFFPPHHSFNLLVFLNKSNYEMSSLTYKEEQTYPVSLLLQWLKRDWSFWGSCWLASILRRVQLLFCQFTMECYSWDYCFKSLNAHSNI